jgi:predicted nucleotidyltransferase
MTPNQIEELYLAHDELMDNPLRRGDRALVDARTFCLLFAWQYQEYQKLLLRCMKVAGKDCKEFRAARRSLRWAENTAKGNGADRDKMREATARCEGAIQYIHQWLDRMRKTEAV